MPVATTSAMKTNALIWILLVAALTAYLAWTLGDPVSIFLMSLALLSALVWLPIVAVVVGVSSIVVWRFLRPRWRAFYAEHRIRFVMIQLAAISFFLGMGFWLNRYWLPHRMHPMSLAVDAVVLIYAVLLLWTLLSPSRRKMIMAIPVTLALAAVTLLLVGLAPGAGSQGGGDALSTLGYLTWVPAEGGAENAGVVYHDSTKAYAGVNIYGPRSSARAYLMDMDGEILHTWARTISPHDDWHHIELLPNGDLIALVRQEFVLCLDWDSNVRWVRQLRAHHDIAVSDSGDVYTLTWAERVVRCHGLPVPILDDLITVLAPDGTDKRTIWLYDILGEIVPRSDVWKIYRNLLHPRQIRWIARKRAETANWMDGSMVTDIFHANTLEVIDRDVDDVFRSGNLLVCSRKQETVAVIDPATEEILWSWGRGVVEWPHHPTLLDNGNLLIFDNGSRRKWTRVIELDPRTREIVWQYTAQNRRDFFSYTRGGNQRLPNGNTLITNSDSGHAFEVTTDGEIVWEFFTPEVDKTGERRSAVYRLMRIVDPQSYPCLDRLTASP
jgi:hypothetical protein